MQRERDQAEPVILAVYAVSEAYYMPPRRGAKWTHLFTRHEGTEYIRTGHMSEELTSRVTEGQHRQVTESVYFGQGQWDKIPFTVKNITEFVVACAPGDEESEARRLNELASELSSEFLNQLVIDTTNAIMDDLFADRFEGLDDES
jgi:hypothetical protein